MNETDFHNKIRHIIEDNIGIQENNKITVDEIVSLTKIHYSECKYWKERHLVIFKALKTAELSLPKNTKITDYVSNVLFEDGLQGVNE